MQPIRAVIAKTWTFLLPVAKDHAGLGDTPNMAKLLSVKSAMRLSVTVTQQTLKGCSSAAQHAARAASSSNPAKPRPRTGSIALEASYVLVDLASFDFGPYQFEGCEPLGALTSRIMKVNVYEGASLIAERRVPMRHDNTVGLLDDDVAELRQAARGIREELFNCARQGERQVVSLARARSRSRRTLQLATRS